MQALQCQNPLGEWRLQAPLKNFQTSGVPAESESNMAVSSFRQRKIDWKREGYCRRN